ncbi:MAG: hemagglutinin repeat-containing protein [Polaromonas sp.]|nr:hemagglutinin repeat-containing protein [Polaromonas sp.]
MITSFKRTETGGSMNIGGNLSMSAGNDFVAQGTQINAAGGVNITAGNDATITTAQRAATTDRSAPRRNQPGGAWVAAPPPSPIPIPT